MIEDAEATQSTAEFWTPSKGIAMFTEGFMLEEGWTGCTAVWKGAEVVWHGRKMFMDRNKEMCELIWMGLTAARDHKDDWAAPGPKAVTIFTNARAALKRIRNDDPGPALPQCLHTRPLLEARVLRPWLPAY
jgi:hypothetical protein